MSGELVPFGKYKGQPAEVLLTDAGYRDWLLAQPWFREKFVTLYQTVINYGGEPKDSPEHNEMQAAFLDDELCFKLTRLLYPNHPFDRNAANKPKPDTKGMREAIALCRRFTDYLTPEYEDAQIVGRSFEYKGWDVVYKVDPASLTMVTASLPLCTCLPCDHNSCPEYATCQGGNHRYSCRHNSCLSRATPRREWLTASNRQHKSFDTSAHCTESCLWSREGAAEWLLRSDRWERRFQPHMPGRVLVECKPDLGDDFPTVLRQVTRYERDRDDRACVIARRASFEKVTWEQVAAIFAASQVRLLHEAQIAE